MNGIEPTVDIHSHYVPNGWPDLEQITGGAGPWPWLRVENEREAMLMLGSTEFRPLLANAWQADARLAQMDKNGVDVQVLSPTPVFFSYERDAREATKVAQIFNDLALEIVEEAPDRFMAFAQVPLQDIDAACRELDRSIENGHRGVEIGNHVGDRDLDDEGIVTFLQHCADRSIPVFIHPWDMADSPRLSRWMAQWLVGMPSETHLSILAMVLGGVFDRLPESLRICFAHGGGSFAYWCGRMDNAFRERPDLIAKSEREPSFYLDRFSVDSLVFTEEPFRLLFDLMGPERIMLGTDYPYPLGEQRAGSLVRSLDFLTDAERSAILGGNAQRFLGLSTGLAGRSGSLPGEEVAAASGIGS